MRDYENLNTLEYCKFILLNVFDTWFKHPIWLNVVKILLGAWTMLAGIHNFLFGITFLIVVDVVTGIIASLKEGKPFNSKKLRKGLLERFLIYNTLILVIWVMEKMVKESFEYDSFYAVMLVCVFIASYECSSLLENMLRINPNYTFLNKVGRILNLFEETAENRLKKGLGVEEKDGEVTE